MPLKRPGAPKGIHSPPSTSLPVAKEVDGKEKRDGVKKEPEMKKERDSGTTQVKLMMLARKREPLKRSAKEEEKAYGQVFVGCGYQKDYEVTTKLGEGTFGCVPTTLF
jgi:serine/threonine-protein kinase BUR1